MSISANDFENMKIHLGDEWAQWVVDATEAKGKGVADAGVKFKTLPGLATLKAGDNPFDDEDDEDEKGENPFADDDDEDEKSFTPANLAMFSGLKQLTEHITATHKELDATRKQVKDLSNQVFNGNAETGSMKDSMRRIEQYLGKLANRQPASKSNASQYSGGDPLIDEVVTNNHKASDAPVPVFNQMKNNIQIPPVSVNTDATP